MNRRRAGAYMIVLTGGVLVSLGLWLLVSIGAGFIAAGVLLILLGGVVIDVES